MASGVAQQSVPRLEMLSQLPPDAVYAAELKKKFVPALTTLRICGNGFAPPLDMTKLMAFSCLKTLGLSFSHMGIETTSSNSGITTCPLHPLLSQPLLACSIVHYT